MNSWEPITLIELKQLIFEAVDKMTETQLEIWTSILVDPTKWKEEEFGKEGGGFWVVGIHENKVIWYNDIEEGFNVSMFLNSGTIEEYGSEQDELQWTIKKLKIKP